MKRIILAITLAWTLVMGLTVAQSMASKMKAIGSSNSEMKGLYSDVRNSQGKNLGVITDLVKDSKGRIAFAILLLNNQPFSMYSFPLRVAVPYGALTCGQQACKLNISEKKLASAPAFTSKKELVAEGKVADDIYRYFGLQPYWTEKGGEAPFMYDY